MLPLRAKVDLGVMAMKEYSAFPKALALFCVISKTFVEEVLPLSRDAVGVAAADWAKSGGKNPTELL